MGGSKLHIGGSQGARPLLVALGTVALIAGVVLSAWQTGSLGVGASPADSETHAAAQSPSRILEATLKSKSLGMDVPYVVYLPPGYDSSAAQRYPVMYMLHGLGADRFQWEQEGLFVAADNLISNGTIQPMIIVTPEGMSSYWINQANGGPRWGNYVSQDLVQEIDSTYRTVATREDRAIGGVSMGAHGALQLAMNTNEFGVVGAHSLVLRKYEEAFPIFGDRAYFDANDPVSLCNKYEARVQDTVIWIDIGQDDKWEPAAQAFHQQLMANGLLHTWHVNPGGHDGAYWSTNLDAYLQFYSHALAIPEGQASQVLARSN